MCTPNAMTMKLLVVCLMECPKETCFCGLSWLSRPTNTVTTVMGWSCFAWCWTKACCQMGLPSLLFCSYVWGWIRLSWVRWCMPMLLSRDFLCIQLLVPLFSTCMQSWERMRIQLRCSTPCQCVTLSLGMQWFPGLPLTPTSIWSKREFEEIKSGMLGRNGICEIFFNWFEICFFFLKKIEICFWKMKSIWQMIRKRILNVWFMYFFYINWFWGF